jgi:hypothetical protein
MQVKYSILVYEDHAVISGLLSCEVLDVLIKLCEHEGFTHLTPNEEGFKLVRKDD